MNLEAVPYKRKISISALTDTGKVRAHNEDNFIVCTDLDNNSWVLAEGWIELSKKGCLIVLADGMGGANAGEVASSIAVDAIKESFSALTLQLVESEAARKEFLLAAILKAHERILTKAKSDQAFEGMGTTIVIAWAILTKLYVCWCGDSRAYKYNTVKGLRLMTKDHSVVWALVEAGRLTPDEADVHPDNNVITQSLGDPANLPKPGIIVEDLEAGDKILLCSDGLNNMVDAKTIENELRSESPLPQITKGLIELANAQGGKDNVTVVILQTSISDSHSEKLAQKKKNPLTLIVPIALIVVILICISFIWESGKGKVNSAPSAPVVLPDDPDSTKSERKNNKPPRVKTRRAVRDSPPAETQNPSPLPSLSTEGASDSLEFIETRMKDLQALMLRWNDFEKVIDSLQAHSKKLDGKEMLRLQRLEAEFESFVTRERLQRLFNEWNSFQDHPDSIKLSQGFIIAGLDRKVEEGNMILFKVNESLKNVKSDKEHEYR